MAGQEDSEAPVISDSPLGRALAELAHLREETSLIVHDLKQPLTVILANVEFLRARTEPGEHSHALRDIQSAAHQALRTIANLLDLARLEARRAMAPAVQPTPIGEVIGSCFDRWARVARAQRVALQRGLICDRRILIDSDLFARTLDNIVDNALRHTPAGGRVELTARDEGQRVRICIGNTGPAIPPAAREQVFEKFAQCDPGSRRNVGLGLYFCRLAVEAQAGTIHVEGTPELATVIVIELPAE